MKITVSLVLIALLAAAFANTPRVQAAARAPSVIISLEHSGAVTARFQRTEYPVRLHLSLGRRAEVRNEGPVLGNGSGGGCAEAGTVHEYAWGWKFYANSCLVGDLAGGPMGFPVLSAAIAKQCRLCAPLAPAIASVFVAHRSWVLQADAVCGYRGIYINGTWVARMIWIATVC